MNVFTEIFKWFTELFKWWFVVLPWEQGLRVRLGKHPVILGPGIHLKVPLYHTAYKQTTRMRMLRLSMQTVTTRDKVTLSIVCSMGYTIKDVLMLYKKLHHPEGTLANIIQSRVAEFVAVNYMKDCTPVMVEEFICENVDIAQYGLGNGYFKVTNYAAVKTIRLLQDQNWIADDLHLDNHVGAVLNGPAPR